MISSLPIYVTSPLIPPLSDLLIDCEKIFLRKILTNNGPCLLKLKCDLQKYLEIREIAILNNGTSALYAALMALKANPGYEVITTPFSFVATSHAITASNLHPVFVDINPNTYNIDLGQIEKSITDRTVAIMPVHVFGNPCDLIGLQEISKKYQIPLIYDAAHAFDVRVDNVSLLSYGDMSVLSMHATKVFNSVEGGAICINNATYTSEINSLVNFGFCEGIPKNFGMNFKMSEIHALVGIHNLPMVKGAISKRKVIYENYLHLLKSCEYFKFQEVDPGIEYNYSYFSVRLTGKLSGKIEQFILDLNAQNIFPRRYFYPSLSSLSMYESTNNLTVSLETSENIMCLPIYPELALDVVIRIAEEMLATARRLL